MSTEPLTPLATAATGLQEALDLLADFERRRNTMLQQVRHVAKLLSTDPAVVEEQLDVTYILINKHLFDCMASFAVAYGDAHADPPEGC